MDRLSKHLTSMNNEAPGSPQASSLETEPSRPADVLRALLDSPKPKEESWQSDAGRAVSILAVGFLKEANDESALRSVALLGLAQSVGVKEVRKRAIKLSRWSEAAPPPLTSLALKDEQQAALNALAKLSTPWSLAYVAQALEDPSLPEEFVPDLLKWAWSTHGDNLKFVHDFFAPQVAGGKSVERSVALLKSGTKLLKPAKPEAAARLAEGVAALVEAFARFAPPKEADDKAFGSGVAALLHFMQEQAAVAPALLMQPSFVMAAGRLSDITINRPASKQVAAVGESLSLATTSLLMADVARNGSEAARHWRAMVPTWRAAYANWDAVIAAASKLTPSLAALTAEGDEDTGVGSEAYATEAVFARLLPAWDAFAAELPDASRAASLSAMLQQAAGTLGIEALGEKGAIVGYDPLSHQLMAEKGVSPNQVRIVRSGVQVRRPDGSARVLVAALVTGV